MKFNFKLISSVIWLLFTFSLASWWFLFVMETVQTHLPSERAHQMIFWEGTTLLSFILVGGATLIFYIYKDQARHEQLRLFFSNFSHDIKTSISRLRLQSELISEDRALQNHSVLKRLLSDINQLDLQLENSLFLSNMEQTKMLSEKIQLTEMLRSVQMEYPELSISVTGQGMAIADTRALRSVLKNLFENSQRHGQADRIDVSINSENNRVAIKIQDNGKGSSVPATLLGSEPVLSSSDHGSGVGLYIVKKLLEKMHGSIHFADSKSAGLTCQIKLPGGPV